ncbi:hypothetical protein BOTBODRAFT_34401 [Botryobasidium botryosum FD-172 SS1]|uniref:Uncharacterized protein n=1 Tax=Botryobasidium botryosum (strain FD-172 SS1) TaxID=930990 RepID=A0A067MA53_BOTB1|nr:hypothetical protein BOTBODRAFT_34401 [Botryobasidium botryosum FD-172 SS1]
MKSLTVAAKGRDSTRDATFALCNLIFKYCFEIDNLRLCGNMVTVTQQQLTRIKHFPKADQVMYYFWVGRLHLSQVKIGSAQENLRVAFDNCTNKNWKTKRTIFTYLLATSLMLGIFPHPSLVDYFGLTAQFGPLIRAIKLGHIAGFKSALDQQRSWFAKRALYIHLREKCEVLVWRSLFRRTLFANMRDRPKLDSTKPPVLTFADLLAALRFSSQDNTIDVNDVECIAVSLLDQNYLRAYILHSSSLLVLHKDVKYAFAPPFIT